MTRYQLKDKGCQVALETLSNEFIEKFKKACEKEYDDGANYICIHFEDIDGTDETGSAFRAPKYVARILKSEIEVIEDLKPSVWYERHRFDGNPNNYILLQACGERYFSYVLRVLEVHELLFDAQKFMYVERQDSDVQKK